WWSSCCSLLRTAWNASPSCEELMDAEEGDRPCGPTDPRPQLPPSRQGLSRIQLTANHGQLMRSLNLDFESPATGFRKFELGKTGATIPAALTKAPKARPSSPEYLP